MSTPTIEYLKKNFDEIAIMGVLAKITSDKLFQPTIDDEMVVQAFRRYKTDFHGASIEEMGNYLSNMDDDSIAGVVNNVKGILHEYEWVAMENSDGDSVVVGMFQNTSHKDYDIWAMDTSTGETWVEQLKTTDNTSYINSWISEHPNGVIRVDEDMAERLDLPSTGLDNEDLEYRVENVIEKMKDLAQDDSVWDYFPSLSAISISIIVWHLYKEYQYGEITAEEFKWMAAKTTGQKVAKIAMLMFLLTLPVINVITGTILIFNLVQSGQKVLDAN
ncbi:MAG: hypothetical protein H8E85_00095 [Candidatus Marinimicrobia bacterium]|nr:hypothetical protein [Candidatus Neomarinimicrobiota bacterium]